jgi:diketogulonate reductase-like aldo/keto reductase
MPFTLKSTVKLNNGASMPLLGLGIYLTRPGAETYQAVKTALETGYRLVDTASFYRNEEEVGRAVRDSAVLREEVFITTKLWNDDHGYDSTLRAFDASLSAWASTTLISTSSIFRSRTGATRAGAHWSIS